MRSAQVNLATERAVVMYDPAVASPAMLIGAVEAAGYGAGPVVERQAGRDGETEARHRDLAGRRRLLGLGIALSIAVMAAATLPGLAGFPSSRSHNTLLALLALPAWLVRGP